MSAAPQFPGLPPGWVEETSSLNDGKIFYRQFRRTDTTRRGRGIFIVHGFGEQSDRFLHFPHYLHTSVDIIGLLDLPGHGKSAGQRGHIESFSQYSEACLIAFRHFEQQGNKHFGSLQIHWIGASMGGLVTLRTLLREPNLKLKSCIVTEALLDIAVKVPWLKAKFGEWIAPIWGTLSLKNEIPPTGLSHLESVQTQYAANPLNHSQITPRTYVEMKREMAAMRAVVNFPYPLLMIVPLADPVVSWKAELAFFKNVQVKGKKELQTFPDFYHEAFNEIGKERVFVALEQWLV